MVPRRSLLVAVIIVAGLEAATVVSQTPSDWTEWGGPHRNFMVDATNLAPSWPADGPRRRWTRTLGEGHSG